jgi:UPF0042 nucleotide-binding protein
MNPDGTPAGVGAAASAPARNREVVLVTGISGSGKSVALHALEDAGYFCVDNLPPEMLRVLIRLEHERYADKLAIAVDVRTASSLPVLVPLIADLKREGVAIRTLFLDASTESLLRRFSETRRPHPLARPTDPADSRRALADAINLERDLLAEMREIATVIDTSVLRPAQLRSWIRSLVPASPHQPTLVFESFAYKFGVPLDADFVFDARVLPNPYYIRELRQLTGRDAPVAAYLDEQPEAATLLNQIESMIGHWLPNLQSDQRSYLTVAIGCTGGQHRSVYLVERLAQRFASRGPSLTRHRQLDVGD